MSELGNKLKTLIGNYNQSTYPTDFFMATMTSPSQFQIDSSQGPVPEQLTIIPDHLDLKEGDTVVVLRKAGGNSYYVMGRLKGENIQNLTDFFTATMTSPNRFEIQDAEGSVTEQSAIVPDHLELEEGNTVVVLRNLAGNSYCVIGRIG